MPLPPDHQRELQVLRQLGSRERWMVRGVAAVAVLIAVTVLVSILSSAPTSSRGCLHATFAGPVGAEEVSACGAQARSVCRSLGAPGGYSGEAARVISRECRKAGLPAGV